jgi:hypothetical protein
MHIGGRSCKAKSRLSVAGGEQVISFARVSSSSLWGCKKTTCISNLASIVTSRVAP